MKKINLTNCIKTKSTESCTKTYFFFQSRRFAHDLSVALKVPHLYFGDRDGGGLRHFLVMKFGCVRRVWTAEQYAIPEIQYVGLSEEDLHLVPSDKIGRIDDFNVNLIKSLQNRPYFVNNQNENITRVNF
jgi:DNA topoisomerase VI subunit A